MGSCRLADPTPFYRADLDKEGRVDNQRDTPPNTRLTVQPIRATSHCNRVDNLSETILFRDYLRTLLMDT